MLKLFIRVVLVAFLLLNSAFAASSGGNKYHQYASDLLKQHKPEMAEMVLNEAIQRYSNSLSLYYLRAKVRGDYLKKYAFAMSDYSLVIRFGRGKYPKAYYRRGDIYMHYSMYGDAIKDYTYCLKIIPNYGKVYFKRANAYLKLGRRTEALIDLKRCVKVSPEYKNQVRILRNENNL